MMSNYDEYDEYDAGGGGEEAAPDLGEPCISVIIS